MKTKIIAIAFMLATAGSTIAQDGGQLFKQNCAVCHSIGKGKLVGPDLKGTHSKYEEEWLLKWIKSSQSLVKKKDPLAVKAFNDNNQIPMPDQNLPDGDIKAIIGFIKAESEAADAPKETATPAVAAGNAGGTNGTAASSAAPAAQTTYKAAAIIASTFCVLLAIVVVVMAQVIKNIGIELKRKAGTAA